MPSEMTPAIVLGSGITALGVIRAFGREKIPVFTLAHSEDLVSYCRWHRRLGERVNVAGDASELASFLRALPLEKAVLYPCSDFWVDVVAELPAELSRSFLTVSSTPQSLRHFLDKELFRKLAVDSGVPAPRTFQVNDLADIRAIPQEVFPQLFLKPRKSQLFFARYRQKAFFTPTQAEAERRFAAVTSVGFEVIFQEYIPGPPTNHYFIDGYVTRRWKLRGLFVRKRLRMYPADFGNSTYMVSVDKSEAGAAISSLEKLFERTQFSGIFSAEFKRDERDNQFKVLEVNVRPWWYVDFAAQCGVNVCMLAYADALGQEVPKQTDYSLKTTCIYPYYDYFAARSGETSSPVSLLTWLQEVLKAKKPIFAWDDPLPWVWSVGKQLWRKVVSPTISRE